MTLDWVQISCVKTEVPTVVGIFCMMPSQTGDSRRVLQTAISYCCDGLQRDLSGFQIYLCPTGIIDRSCHKYHFCRAKGFVTTNTCLSRQLCVCHDKTRLLS